MYTKTSNTYKKKKKKCLNQFDTILWGWTFLNWARKQLF